MGLNTLSNQTGTGPGICTKYYRKFPEFPSAHSAHEKALLKALFQQCQQFVADPKEDRN